MYAIPIMYALLINVLAFFVACMRMFSPHYSNDEFKLHKIDIYRYLYLPSAVCFMTRSLVQLSLKCTSNNDICDFAYSNIAFGKNVW